jgi:hypothetical protein
VVVAVGLTPVEPLAEVEVNEPGVMEMLVAPVVVQLSVLLEPAAMLAGFAMNELIVGLLPPALVVTTTVSTAEVVPAEFVA